MSKDNNLVTAISGDTSVPAVSVAMPIFNNGKPLREAVLSILYQTFEDWELILIDDGSTDGSVDEISDILDPRIRFLRDGTNKGHAARLNEAIDLARGGFFARMDGDDISYPDRFRCQVEYLHSHPEVDLLGVGAMAISEESEALGVYNFPSQHEQICAAPWRDIYLMHPTWMGRTEWFRRHHYAVPASYLCEDRELLLRSFQSSRFAGLPETLFAYRIRSRFNWCKAFQTRIALCKVQCRHFLRNRQYWSLVLACLMLFGRIALDLINAILQLLRLRNRHLRGVSPASADEKSALLIVLSHLKTSIISKVLAVDATLGSRDFSSLHKAE